MGKIITPAKITMLAGAIVLLLILLWFAYGLARWSEAQGRIRANRAKSEMRKWATILEKAREVDGHYPLAKSFPIESLKDSNQRIPAADLGMLPYDGMKILDPCLKNTPLIYATVRDRFVMLSSGPDKAYSLMPMQLINGEIDEPTLVNNTYDPTNGTYSVGDVYLLSEVRAKKE